MRGLWRTGSTVLLKTTDRLENNTLNESECKLKFCCSIIIDVKTETIVKAMSKENFRNDSIAS